MKDRDAIIDGAFRYRLDRRVRPHGDRALLFVMLNPSTADAVNDDRTIHRCVDFAFAHGFSRFIVCNLFAFRSPFPDDVASRMRCGQDVVGPQNDDHIAAALDEVAVVCCAWGRIGKWAQARVASIWTLVESRGSITLSLGENTDGSPPHPLYLPTGTQLRPWKPRGESPADNDEQEQRR